MNFISPPLTFGSLSANFDTTSVGDNLVEAGTVPSRFRKKYGNVVYTFQEPITWIFLSKKCSMWSVSSILNL